MKTKHNRFVHPGYKCWDCGGDNPSPTTSSPSEYIVYCYWCQAPYDMLDWPNVKEPTKRYEEVVTCKFCTYTDIETKFEFAGHPGGRQVWVWLCPKCNGWTQVSEATLAENLRRMVAKEWNTAIEEPDMTDEEWAEVVAKEPEDGYTLRELQESIRRNGFGCYHSPDIHISSRTSGISA